MANRSAHECCANIDKKSVSTHWRPSKHYLTSIEKSTRPFQSGKGSLQIIHIDNNHWVVASTMNCRNADIAIYDSMNSSVSIETQSILASLLKTQKDQLTIQIAKVNKQSGTQDCGVFAAAYCTTVAFGKDPCAFVYDLKHLRYHLLKCLEDGKMTTFPIIRERRTASTSVSMNVHCICRGPDTGEAMVACDRCKKWYHAECVEGCLNDLQQNLWFCSNCASL